MAQIIHEGKAVRILFSGQLTFTACETLDAEIEQALSKEPESVAFDLAEVTFITSVFLRLCLKTFKKMGQEHFSIINASPTVKKIFSIAGLAGMVKTA